MNTFASGFSSPDALALDGAGTLYVTDGPNNAVDTVTASAVTVPFMIGGTATAGTDYSNFTASPLVIPAGQTFGAITGQLFPHPGGNQTITFTLGTPSGNATLGSPASNTLTITEPTPTPTPTHSDPDTHSDADPTPTPTSTPALQREQRQSGRQRQWPYRLHLHGYALACQRRCR